MVKHTNELQISQLFQDGVLLNLSIGFWQARMGISKVAEALKIDQTLWNEGLTGGGVVYFIDKETRNTFTKIDCAARTFLASHSLEFALTSGRFVPVTAYEKVVATLEEIRHQFFEERDAFLKNFDQHKRDFLDQYKEVKLRDGTTINASEAIERFYPTAAEVRSKFYFHFIPTTLDMPLFVGDNEEVAMEHAMKVVTNLKMGKEERAKMTEQYRQQIDDFIKNDVVVALRQEIMKSIQNYQAIIVSGNKVSSRTFNKVINDIERFKDLNFVGDKEIETMIDEFKEKYLKLNPEDVNLKKNDDNEAAKKMRETIANATGALLKKIGQADVDEVTGRYRAKLVIPTVKSAKSKSSKKGK